MNKYNYIKLNSYYYIIINDGNVDKRYMENIIIFVKDLCIMIGYLIELFLILCDCKHHILCYYGYGFILTDVLFRIAAVSWVFFMRSLLFTRIINYVFAFVFAIMGISIKKPCGKIYKLNANTKNYSKKIHRIYYSLAIFFVTYGTISIIIDPSNILLYLSSYLSFYCYYLIMDYKYAMFRINEIFS